MKYELVGSIGFSNFLGDLGGADQKGTHLIRDIDFFATRPVVSGGIRFKPYPFLGVKSTSTIGLLGGDDRYTNDLYRRNRNLNFRAPILELTCQAEFYFIRERAPKIYSFKFIGNKKKQNIGAYGFLGVGTLFFMPQGKLNGHWYNLRKLSTEGQGLPGGPKPYLPVTVCIPYGIGIKYGLTKQINVGAELGFRYTFSDYIDDVSTTYYDHNTLVATKGATAANLADPSLNLIKGATKSDAKGNAAQRGNPKNNDTYAFLQVNVNYKIFKTQKRKTRSKF